MSFNSTRQLTGCALAVCMVAVSAPAVAQVGMSDEEIMDLPPEYHEIESQTDESDFGWSSDSSIGADGVETIIRTRRIEHRSPPVSSRRYETDGVYTDGGAIPVLERDAWIEECNRRTRGHGESEKGSIIGGLLGAVFGGVVGNRVAGAGDRLAGTLVGAGAGGLGGALLGGLIGGGKKNGRYDCEAALDGYLAGHHAQSARVARRVIAAPVAGAGGGYPAYAPAMPHQPRYHGPVYPGTGYYAPAYHYPQQVQVVYVPVTYEQPQQVIVRENIREETYMVPGVRMIEQPRPRQPAPSPKMIKQ